jgi:molybdopterin synthase sulfur carrier subunit
LRDLTQGQEILHAVGITVRQIIDSLDREYPGIKDRLCVAGGLRPGIAVAVNGQLAPLGLLQAVPEGSEVHFLPAVSGGDESA